MTLLCVHCEALLEAGNVYCLNCGRPVADSVEQETVIRPRSEATTFQDGTVSKWAIIAGWFGKTLLLAIGSAIVLIGMILGALALMPKDGTGSTPTASTDRVASDNALSIPTPTTEPPRSPVRLSSPSPRATIETPDNTSTRSTRTPIRNSEDAVANANANANAKVSRPAPKIPLVRGWPMFDSSGRRIRAICNNGRPSYWQYDRVAVCGANGGVAEVFW